MANRLSKEKAEAIASEYMTNGFNKIQALKSVGYSNTYSENVGLKLFVNDRVLQAIDRIQAKSKASTDYKLEQYLSELEQARSRAIDYKQVSAEIQAIIAKGRSQGFDKDNDMTSDQTEELDKSQTEEARRLASIRLKTGS